MIISCHFSLAQQFIQFRFGEFCLSRYTLYQLLWAELRHFYEKRKLRFSWVGMKEMEQHIFCVECGVFV